jgi:hypothetical protein
MEDFLLYVDHGLVKVCRAMFHLNSINKEGHSKGRHMTTFATGILMQGVINSEFLLILTMDFFFKPEEMTQEHS